MRILLLILIIGITPLAYSEVTTQYSVVEDIKWRDHGKKKFYSVRVLINIDGSDQTKYFYFDEDPSNTDIKRAVDNYINSTGV